MKLIEVLRLSFVLSETFSCIHRTHPFGFSSWSCTFSFDEAFPRRFARFPSLSSPVSPVPTTSNNENVLSSSSSIEWYDFILQFHLFNGLSVEGGDIGVFRNDIDRSKQREFRASWMKINLIATNISSALWARFNRTRSADGIRASWAWSICSLSLDSGTVDLNCIEMVLKTIALGRSRENEIRSNNSG